MFVCLFLQNREPCFNHHILVLPKFENIAFIVAVSQRPIVLTNPCPSRDSESCVISFHILLWLEGMANRLCQKCWYVLGKIRLSKTGFCLPLQLPLPHSSPSPVSFLLLKNNIKQKGLSVCLCPHSTNPEQVMWIHLASISFNQGLHRIDDTRSSH